MKSSSALAIFTKDRAVLEPAMAAAMESGRGLHLASSAPEAFAKIQRELGGVDMFLVDTDANVHGVALLNALSFCSDRIPVVVITSLEPAYMEPLAASKGAVACLGKPVTKEQITGMIRQFGDPAVFRETRPPVPTLRRGWDEPGSKFMAGRTPAGAPESPPRETTRSA